VKPITLAILLTLCARCAWSDEVLVFFTVVTAGRRAVLACAEALEVLRGLWERSAQANQWWVGDYLLMPDHVHFFARAGRGAEIMKDWVQMWKSVSARILLKRLGLGPPFWQEDYFDRYLRSGDHYSEKWAYVEANPVRAGLVAKPEDWAFRGRIHDLRF
jgi:putative transposase